MTEKNKNKTARIIESTVVNVGFIAMTAASLLISAPHPDKAGAQDSEKGHSYAAIYNQGQEFGQERHEEIRHDPHIYGAFMLSPSTAGSE